jgi:hypothetical protein
MMRRERRCREATTTRYDQRARNGIGFGSALAIAISYTTNKSILCAIIHGILGWLYVIYFALVQS